MAWTLSGSPVSHVWGFFYNTVFENHRKSLIYLQNVMHERSLSAWNPLEKSTQNTTEVLTRILTNTMEQFVIFTFSSTILSIYLKPYQMKIIPIFVVIWVIARLAFD